MKESIYYSKWLRLYSRNKKKEENELSINDEMIFDFLDKLNINEWESLVFDIVSDNSALLEEIFRPWHNTDILDETLIYFSKVNSYTFNLIKITFQKKLAFYTQNLDSIEANSYENIINKLLDSIRYLKLKINTLNIRKIITSSYNETIKLNAVITLSVIGNDDDYAFWKNIDYNKHPLFVPWFIYYLSSRVPLEGLFLLDRFDSKWIENMQLNSESFKKSLNTSLKESLEKIVLQKISSSKDFFDWLENCQDWLREDIIDILSSDKYSLYHEKISILPNSFSNIGELSLKQKGKIHELTTKAKSHIEIEDAILECIGDI